MKRYVLFVGGGGARAAEALLVAASAGVLRPEALHVLLADTDHRGLRSAELLSAKYADYGRIQLALSYDADGNGLRPFGTALDLVSWPASLPGGGTKLSAWTQDKEEDALLCQAMFAKDAGQLDLRSGFHGMRELGKTVFAGLLHEAQQNPQDPLTRMLADMNEATASGEEVRVIICGSVTGGMGAAGVPLLARHVQAKTQGRARIGAVLLAADGDHEDPARAREAIDEFAGESACSAVCLLGLPRSSSSDAPADSAHLLDWLAIYCMDILLHRPAWPEGLFTVQTGFGGLSWDIFGKAAQRYRMAYGRLLKVAAAWNHVIAPKVEKRLRHPFFLRDNLFGWYAHFFRRGGWSRSVCLEDVARTSRLMRVVILWLGSLMHTLPPEMTHGAELAEAQETAERHYRELAELAGQLTMLEEEAQQSEAYEESRVYRNGEEAQSESAHTGRRIDAIRQEIDRRREEQEKLNRRIGGAATVQVLQRVLADAKEQSRELHARYQEANRRIDHAEAIAAPQDQYRITDARTKLERMARHQKMLDTQENFIREDVQAVCGDAVRFSKPEIRGAGAGKGIFHAKMLDRLLLMENRVRPAEVEAAYPQLVQPADGRTLKMTLKQIRKADVSEAAPVMSLLEALILEAMEEV